LMQMHSERPLTLEAGLLELSANTNTE